MPNLVKFDVLTSVLCFHDFPTFLLKPIVRLQGFLILGGSESKLKSNDVAQRSVLSLKISA